MKSILEAYSANRSGIFQEKKSSAFNGKAFFPYYDFTLTYSLGNWNFSILGSYSPSEQSRRNPLNGGMYVSQSRLQIKASINAPMQLADFKIGPRPFLERVFTSKKDKVKIVSTNADLKRKLLQNAALKEYIAGNEGTLKTTITGGFKNSPTYCVTAIICPEGPTYEREVIQTIELIESLVSAIDLNSSVH